MLQALHEAVRGPCGHGFCRSCVEPSSKCPECGGGLRRVEVWPEAEARLGALLVSCPNRDRGCFWARAREKLELHLDKTCKHASRPCRQAPSCPYEGKGSALRAHESSCSHAPPPPALVPVAVAMGSPRVGSPRTSRSGSQLSRSGEALARPRSSSFTEPLKAQRGSSGLSSPVGGGGGAVADREEMLRLVMEVEALLVRKQGSEREATERAERAEREVKALREEVEALRTQMRKMLEEEDARVKELRSSAKREGEKRQQQQQQQEHDAEKKKREEEEKEKEAAKKRALEADAAAAAAAKQKKEEEEKELAKARTMREAEEEALKQSQKKEEQERVEREAGRRKRREEKAELEEAKKKEQAEKAKREAMSKAAEEQQQQQQQQPPPPLLIVTAEPPAQLRESQVEAMRKLREAAVSQERAEPPLPVRRAGSTRKKGVKDLSLDASSEASSTSSSAGPSPSPRPLPELGAPLSVACVRTMLLMATEKLRGDSDLKADMPLTTVPGPRVLLLLRSGVLLGKTVARMYPGRFDPLCLRTKGGETAWQQNLQRIWETCPFLPALLQPLVLEGFPEAALSALRLVMRDAHSARARAACKQWLGARAEQWPLLAVMHAWVACWNNPGGEGPNWETMQPEAVPVPSTAQLCEALAASGSLQESRRTVGGAAPATGGASLVELLKGSPLEGAVLPEEEHQALPEDALEMVLLWAAAKNSQKSKLRSSVIRAAGSDTSWIDRDSKKK